MLALWGSVGILALIGAGAASSCDTIYAEVVGELGTSGGDTDSRYLLDTIDMAENDDTVEALILAVDSPGGDPVAAEEIAGALSRMTKPNVAVIRGMGASAAYWAAIGADRVFASAISDVGSIGVTMSYVEESKRIEEEGGRFNQLSTGKYKDLGDPSKPLTEEERALVMRDLEEVHNVFVDEVARYRDMPRATVMELADGSSMTGRRALDAGLIDEIGNVATARAYLAREYGIDAEVCMYEEGSTLDWWE
jgi:protease-4